MALTRATDKIVGNSDGNLNLSGIVTASSFSGSGANLSGINTAFGNSSVNTSGIITATSFFGDGSNLTNLPAGLGTALSSTQTSPLNKLYFTNEVLSIGATVTVDHPATSTGAYTQYADIRLEEGADLIIEDGDDVIPDILGLGTDGGGLGAGGSGRIRVDSITNKNANGAPNFPNGLTGTAGTFTDNLTVSGNLGVGGTLTYEDVTNIDSVGVITARSGINVSGGNLLVGTTSGSGKLHVEDSGQILAYIVGNTSSAGSRLVLQNKNTTANCFTGVEGADAGGQTTASILFYNANNSTNEGFLALQTRPANGLPTERLRIGSAGQFGIGGANYGTSGQVLTSGGASGAVSWKGGGGLQVLEQFSSPADGSSFTTNKGTVTVQNPTNYQSLTTALNDAQGSVITYQPPDGAVQVIYEFQYAIASDTDSNAILGARLLWDGQEITHSRFGQRGGTNYFDQLNTFKWVFNIGGSTDYSVGRLASWTSGKVIKLQMSEHNSDYEFAINLLRNYGSSGAINVFRRPIISITAIGTPS